MQWTNIIGSDVSSARTTTESHRWRQRSREPDRTMSCRGINWNSRGRHFRSELDRSLARTRMNAGRVAHTTVMQNLLTPLHTIAQTIEHIKCENWRQLLH